jgi:microcompartment protein CcmL/EutN
MAYTQADIDALKSAIATGARDVQRGDERVSYRSLADMKEALRMMENEVSGATSKARQRTLTPRSTRGF